MRHLIITLLALALCLPPGHARSEPRALESLAWLAGCWSRVDGEPGSGENWTPLAGETLFGISRTVRGGKTVAFEFMQIQRAADGAIELIAHPSGQATTTFRLVEAAGHKAVFENPAHDFPQRVIYQLRGADDLLAWIEGEADGEFTRVEFPMVRSHDGTLCASGVQAGDAAPAPPPATPASPAAPGFSADQSALLAVAEEWATRYNAGDPAGVAGLYTADGYYASAHILAHGREQIEQYWAQGIAAGGHLDFIHPIEVYADGALGYVLGKYQATNAGVTVDGRIVIVGKRQAGQWKIAVHETVVRDQPE
jgi:ketosteroid isomerase-like protein